jgi:hypothetical protein
MMTKEIGAPPMVIHLLCVTKSHLELPCCNVAAFGDLEPPICGEGRAPPSECEQPKIGVAKNEPDLRFGSRCSLYYHYRHGKIAPLAQCARGHKIGPFARGDKFKSTQRETTLPKNPIFQLAVE